ncbi:MAG: hypothetical protein L0Z62_13630 [Gemmataceae bacterium]|nr:hypothetical protein [Gemmataceae bacterium]
MTPRLLPLLVAGWLCSAVPAEPPLLLIEQKDQAASAWALTSAKDLKELRLADEVPVRLCVKGRAPLIVEPLGQPKRTASWELEEKAKPQLSAGQGQGQSVWVWELLLVPLQPGEHTIELPPLRYRTGNGEPCEVHWTPLKVQVVTRIKKVEPGSAEGITGLEAVPGVSSLNWWVWVAAGSGALLLAALALFLVRRQAPRRPSLPPAQWALRELGRLAENTPASAEEVERFHTALAAILRRYLEAQFRLPAERRTTPEFLEAARRSPELSAEQQALLGEVLACCDLAKFARVRPTAEECQATVTAARRFVEQTAPSEREVVEPPGGRNPGERGV